MKLGLFKTWIFIVILALLYYAFGRIGQLFAIPPGHVTPMWPPAAIALVALLIWGYQVWPGIFLGSLMNNFLLLNDPHFTSLLTSSVIGAGASLQAICAAFFINHYIGANNLFKNSKYSFRFIIIAFLSCLIGATIGTTALNFYGVIPTNLSFATWLTWWLGNSTGLLIIAPLILIFYHREEKIEFTTKKAINLFLICTLLILSIYLIFYLNYPIIYILLPLALWVIYEFGLQGVTFFIAIVSSFAYWYTIQGVGPFILSSLSDSILFLEGFIAVIATTSIILASVLNERKTTTKLLELLNAELGQELVEKNGALKELEIKQKILELTNNNKNQFLANMGHEMRTPLNAILGYCEILMEDPQAKELPDFYSDLMRIHLSAKRLLDTIQNVFKLVDIQSGDIKLDLKEIDVFTLTSELQKIFEPLAQRNQNTFSMSIAQPIGTMVSDPLLVRQILLNIIDNACKFCKNGSVQLLVNRAQNDSGEWMVFSISDTGIGISSKGLRKLFQPFSQVDGSPTRKFEGLGLGLYLSKRYSQILGGDISINSIAGKGSTFTLMLPTTPENIEQ